MRLLASLCAVSYTVRVAAQKKISRNFPSTELDGASFQVTYPSVSVSTTTPARYFFVNEVVSNFFNVTWQNVTYLAVESALKQIQKQRGARPERTIRSSFTLCRGGTDRKSGFKLPFSHTALHTLTKRLDFYPKSTVLQWFDRWIDNIVVAR